MDSTFVTFVQTNSRRPVSAKCTYPQSISENITVPVKFTYMNRRPRSSYATPPSRKVAFAQCTTSPNIGPGKYNPPVINPTPSYEFSRCERFGSGDFFAKLFLFKKLTEKDKEKINERIGKNKEDAIKTKEERIKDVDARAAKRRIRTQVTQKAKKNLEIEKKNKISTQIKEKLQKYEYRMRLPVCNK